MRHPLRTLAFLSLPAALSAAPAWQQVTVPTVAEAAAAFPKPPPEYGAIHWFTLGGPQSRERLQADIENLAKNGVTVAMIDNSRGLRPKYFSPEYMDLIKFVIDQCKAHGIKLWIEGDGGYPDGFAGGLISKDYPQLGMQAVVADARYSVAAGQTLKLPLPPDTLGILAYKPMTGACSVIPMPPDGQLSWTAPDPGVSEVVFVRHVYRSSPTRYTNRADGTGDKDSLYSLIDYLDPQATRTYLRLIYDAYYKMAGADFGSTILGFRGDETDFTGFMPWTPKLLETFRQVKGYDLLPYLPRFFMPTFPPDVLRAKADYWDVWSAMFRDNFFKIEAEWCEARGVEYMVHLNHEETMLDLSRAEDMIHNEGSFFRDMRYVDVPGIDNLNQIQPGIVADFPKLAADAAHLYGRPLAWEEEGGSPGQAGKFVADYNLVRGVNSLNIRGMNEAYDSKVSPLLNPAAAIAGYVNRASYMDAIGRPAAQVALYHPDDSMWLGDEEADRVDVRLTTELMEHQIDFDAIDPDALASICTVEGGTIRNLSGQVYRAIVFPSTTVISRAALDRLRTFAAGGGKVIFVGKTPTLVVDRTFLHPEPNPPDLSFALLEPDPHITDRVVAALPPPDVKLDSPCPALKYIHHSLQDGEVYFFFNEGYDAVTRTARLAGSGQAQIWDPTDGSIHVIAGASDADGFATVPLVLQPHESRLIVVGSVPPGAAQPFPALSGATDLADLGGDWSLSIGGRDLSGPLQSWESRGVTDFTGVAHYRKEFTLGAPPSGQRVDLDLGNAREIVHVRLNGVDFDSRPWPPYRWDVTSALRGGSNTLEVDVQLTPVQQRRFGSMGGSTANYASRRGETVAAPPNDKGNFWPTGVPGGLPRVQMGPRRGFGSPFTANYPQPPPASGLLGPVRLVTR